jgi:hypothetical protein
MDDHDLKFLRLQTEWLGALLQSPGKLSACATEMLNGLATFWKNRQKWPRE